MNLPIHMSYNVSEKYRRLSIEVLRRFVRFVTGLDPLRMKLNWNFCESTPTGSLSPLGRSAS